MSTDSKPRRPQARRAGGFAASFAQPTPTEAPPPTAADPAEPAATMSGADQSPPPAMSDSPRDLARFLGEQGESDSGGAGFFRRMLAGPPPDPMLDLVQLGASVPRHYKEALRLLAFAQRRHQQALVIDALAAYIGPQLLDEALAAVQEHQRR
ncbi:hypothetical protein [Micromonospora thermarum]|uniref:Uncharacterized protein n=1 Tax=Micromonospora thermarum TaxID=2720024 RepID=A0ABX0Z791_9ACTN|nr:hypothetical protein [Micromonospora thermarum]NJP33715.1 hypothetical protein [Micromonospora thermarum]